jgi:hypothetical protein
MKRIKWIPVLGIVLPGSFDNDFQAMRYFVYHLICIIALAMIAINIYYLS